MEVNACTARCRLVIVLGRLDINEGQTVAISGEVRKVPPAEEIQSRWKGLNASERTPLENQQVYLHAERVDIAK